MANNNVRLPSSGGGLVQYFEDYKSKLEISPKLVVAIIVVIAVIEIFLYKTIG